MQADRMCRAEAAITIQKKTFFLKRRGGHPYNEWLIVHCLKMAQKQRLVNRVVNLF